MSFRQPFEYARLCLAESPMSLGMEGLLVADIYRTIEDGNCETTCTMIGHVKRDLPLIHRFFFLSEMTPVGEILFA